MARISFQDFHFTKTVSKDSPQAIHLEDVLVSSVVVSSSAEKASAPYLDVRLEDVLVSSYTTAGTGGDSALIGSPEQNVFAGGPGDYLLV